MKLFTALIQRITALLVMLVMVIGANAANRTFATIADMNAATDLVDGDVVTITNDVVMVPELVPVEIITIPDEENQNNGYDNLCCISSSVSAFHKYPASQYHFTKKRNKC